MSGRSGPLQARTYRRAWLRGDGRPDDVLVTAAIEGDPLAFDELASRHRRSALRAARAVIGPDQAEDVVQDALLLAYRALPTIHDRTKFPGWLFSIVRYRAFRLGRSESRLSACRVSVDEKELADSPEPASPSREQDTGDEVVLDALERVPRHYSDVLRLHFLHGFSHRRIAERLGVAISTVKWRCHRGKELLRTLVAARLAPPRGGIYSLAPAARRRPKGILRRADSAGQEIIP